ncbi:MAG TPA: T9SS type A sorting domain-containing protein [Flavobacteriaceae bacterium]|nr:T9SS type A sorting domain-containing protein [Flavobacteriaceae bacterium]
MKNLVLVALIILPTITNAQLINGDFEDIHTVTTPVSTIIQKPVNWNFGYSSGYGTEMTTDSYSGNYAVKIWSWYFVQSNEEFFYGEQYSSGDSISTKPDKLKGFYKFENPNIQFNVPDSAFVQISLSKYNNVTNQRDTIAFAHKNLGEIYQYSEFEIDFDYLDMQQIPDSIQIMFRTSFFQGPSDNTNENNYLYLDNLSLEYNTMSIPEHNQNKILVYPNPAHNVIQIKSDQNIEKIKIYSMTGGIIEAQKYQKIGQSISYDISSLSKGIYFIEIFGTENRILDKVKLVKN